MKTKRLPKSLRKYISKEKAKIRKNSRSFEDEKAKILKLYQNFKKDENKGNI